MPWIKVAFSAITLFAAEALSLTAAGSSPVRTPPRVHDASSVAAALSAWAAVTSTSSSSERVTTHEVDSALLTDPRASKLTHYAAAAFPDALGTVNAANLACRRGHLTVNGEPSSGARYVREGDLLRLVQRPSHRTSVPLDAGKANAFCERRANLLNVLRDTTKQSTPLQVLYEDDCMAIVAKPAGVHTMAWAESMASRTLCLDAVLPLILTPPPSSTCKDPLPAPLPRHRLDARVSGPIVVAKTRAAHVALGRCFENEQVTKEYRAIVVGYPILPGLSPGGTSTASKGAEVAALLDPAMQDLPLGILNEPGTKEGIINEVFDVHRDIDGLSSHTTAVVLGEGTPCAVDGWLTDLALFPHTGRRHQLRRHCAEALQTPILGDDLHDGSALLSKSNCQGEFTPAETNVHQKEVKPPARKRIGLFLYCRKISIPHPLTPGRIVTAEVPEPVKFARHRAKARSGWEWQQVHGQLEKIG